LESLIKRGVIEPCPAYVVNRMLQATRKEHGEIADRVHATPSLQSRLAQLTHELTVLQSALDALPRNARPAEADAVTSLEG
jgi:hypothetical protein